MKHLKMLAVAAFAATALVALLGAGTASATVMCKVTPGAGAACSSKYANGQVYKFKATDPVLTNNGRENVTCASSEATIAQTSAGSTTTTVLGKITGLSFTSCHTVPSNIACSVLPKSGSVPYLGEIHYKATHNGTITVFASAVQVSCGFGILGCVFGGESLDLELVGGNPAVVQTNEASLELTEEFGFEECPSAAKWDAEYKATSPTSIFVGIS